MRLFIAIELQEELRQALASVREQRPLEGEGVRWVSADLMHLTLRFLGEVDAARLAHVTQLVSETSSSLTAFDLVVRGLGCFPSLRAPRVFYAGVEGTQGPSDPLTRLAAKLESRLREEGFDPDDRPFRPHVTLARIRKRGVRARDELSAREPVLGQQIVQHITIFESLLSARKRPQHVVRHRAPLIERSMGN